jgi:plasmid stability protein
VDETTALFVRKFPVELKNRFKAICARDGRSMQDVLESLIRGYVVAAETPDREERHDREARQVR